MTVLLAVPRRYRVASNARIGVAVAKYYPKLSLSGSATTVSSGQLFTSGTSQAAGVLGLRWRLFDFGRINAQIEQAKGQEAEMLAAYRLIALRATETVENAFSALVKHEEQATVLSLAWTCTGCIVCGISKRRRQPDRGLPGGRAFAALV